MSSADRSRYSGVVTSLSEGELHAILGAAEPSVCLLGGWAVHRQVNTGFQEAHGRPYLVTHDMLDDRRPDPL